MGFAISTTARSYVFPCDLWIVTEKAGEQGTCILSNCILPFNLPELGISTLIIVGKIGTIDRSSDGNLLCLIHSLLRRIRTHSGGRWYVIMFGATRIRSAKQY